MKKFLVLIVVLLLSGCVYQNVTLNSSRITEDGTEIEITSRTINFAFSEYIEHGIAKLIAVFSGIDLPDVPTTPPPEHPPVIKPEPPPVDPPPSGFSTRFDHYNPTAFDGKGVAIVFCKDSPMYYSCKINNQPMFYHGLDMGRHTWRNFESFLTGGPVNVGGIIECFVDGKTTKFKVKAHGKQCGSCRVGAC